MWGLAGIVPIAGSSDAQAIEAALRRMCDSMRTRGPDAEGYWGDPGTGVMLGHRRLAILDLHDRANQPIVADDGRYVAAQYTRERNQCA